MNPPKKHVHIWFVCGTLALIAGCTTAGKRNHTHNPNAGSAPTAATLPEGGTVPGPLPSSAPEISDAMGPPAPFGPPEPSSAPTYGPEPIQVRPLVLVLGPGVVKGFAHSGVFEALNAAKVPIGAVLGTEMGALIGAIYSQDTNINHMQWELMKYKEDVFLSEKGLFPTHRVEAELSKYFGDKDLHSSRIPCVVAFEEKTSGAVELADRGSAKEALRSAIAFPNMMDPGSWKGGKAVATKKSLKPLIQQAKSLGIGPVVVIDTARETNPASPPEGADLVIQPDLRGVQDLDFKKRTEATFRGKKAVTANLKEIFHWAGMPQGDR